ncbi:LPXTG cell wall anchor domain-containing protein [Vagococcus coleopterorum]|uniref:LPXTG cell wall anchor domain-containing protein n=1 Tax=Vagococcus coleopterorum TaxID=2714946 RepID=A0A6G8APF5_9ENTE|nr:MucBP domain-containing protein [Vagococcus coleopterorum]QIL46803.1 LPXTG cell wall anchor domain-containing protein [Vagococcus coleopterorum]
MLAFANDYGDNLSMTDETPEQLVPDEGLRKLMIANTKNENFTISDLEKLTVLNFDGTVLTEPIIINDYKGLEYCKNIYAIGSVSGGPKVELNNLEQLVEILNTLPKMEQLRFMNTEISDPSPLGKLESVVRIGLKLEYKLDLSNFSELISKSRFQELILNYDNRAGKAFLLDEVQTYDTDNSGIKALSPVVLPDTHEFDFELAKFESSDWSYNNQWFVNPKGDEVAEGSVVLTVMPKGPNAKKIRFGESFTTSPSSIKIRYPYIVEKKVAAPITVNYVDSNGTQIKDSLILEGNLGESVEISTPDIDGHVFEKADKDLKMIFSEESQTITLTYKESIPWQPIDPEAIGKAITVNYVDTAGKVIKDSTQVTGTKGTQVTIEVPEITGYKYDHADHALNMEITNQAQTITLTYKESIPWQPIDPEAIGKAITVNYVDTAGKVIKDSTQVTGTKGTQVTIEVPEITGFKYDHADHDLNMEITNQAQTITLTYKEVEENIPWQPIDPEAIGKAITVNYVDTAGKVIKDSTQVTGTKGTQVTIEVPEITGFKYDHADHDLNMEITNQAQTITLTYKETKEGTELIPSYPSDESETIETADNSDSEKIESNHSSDLEKLKGQSLPQTGEGDQFYLLFITGVLLVLGSSILIARKKI